MKRYCCNSCSYSIEQDNEPKRCPYCSKVGMEEEENAEELLKEV